MSVLKTKLIFSTPHEVVTWDTSLSKHSTSSGACSGGCSKPMLYSVYVPVCFQSSTTHIMYTPFTILPDLRRLQNVVLIQQ
jgi:hypothetical protein